MSISVFLSHNHNDKPFVRKLARDLENHGVRYWLDETEMKIGDSSDSKNQGGN
ncbi:toll/interleukin-1 receptor domain-containing protein [Salmonella enterica]|uniref:toll/interleukin-1 receptor domain-containing protein n=1 Tax=Salmonella enterica TaxID=28901 RepID=UPI0024C09B72|nr:toll/interleukin-1 receptor domain-containing protein [Salmonella enterica]WHW57110.1 toll/interleukin-1 receptor domain-containing protein [Salmonella enterica subsp. enterica serovar Muenchen]WHW70946.1 toll/interleukin-1 receptor domain-containing protein [Salmonella enterica subsp. enterica serovar Muenchen]WHW75694.1 toll/interleukin-1 receptor domain-containing protein [Salmonella enterica subsp. enterica serovar Muenchen]WHW80436.1 toll/interleukin-1 receptor domain-containing protein